jgi:stage II sporulation protein D
MFKKRKEVPEIEVGIISSREITFSTKWKYNNSSGVIIPAGRWVAKRSGVKILINNGSLQFELDSGVVLLPVSSENRSFTVHSVTIGINFHWQRQEDQVFVGKLKLYSEGENITLVNILSLEDYLESVISSEMKATASPDLLKAHAVISRSWLIAQIEKRKSPDTIMKKYNPSTITENEIVRWYDREDHTDFDVCADDHCQRYQGITRATEPAIKKVISETYGEVMAYEGAICDTRYSKCCGGASELFENAWEPVHHHYLQRVEDCAFPVFADYPDLTIEDNARNWILGNPEAFCNTHDKSILSQVLNDYDQETNDFFRWKVSYSEDELSDLVKERTGIDFGKIMNLIPVERGVSGRIIRLRIEGAKKTMMIGKELEIRKALSKSHLYSSCFIVEKIVVDEKINFIIHGAGWGHGVGLCQIGAAVMGAEGYTYREILSHYFRGAELVKLY